MIFIKLHHYILFFICNTWEQRKLGELVDVYDGVHQTPDYQDSGIMFLSVENISTLKSNKYISTEAFERDYKVYPEKGDILMTRIGDIGTTNVVESTDKMAFYVSLALLKLKDLDSYFLSNAMKNEPFQKGLRQRSLLTAIPQKINKEEIGKTDIFITKNPVEQKKIGEYFSTLDHLITLHQRKYFIIYNKLITWEQRKVSDLLQERNEQTPMSKEYPLMAFIANLGVAPKGERYDRSALVNDEAGKKYKKTEYGDFIYSSNNLEAGSIGLNKYGNACISPVYSIFKPIGKADLDFLGRRFLRKDFINEMVKWRQGVVYGQWKIHESDFLNIEIEVPSVDEQKAIGRYLDFLDHLITLHQRKCDDTKELKKYMLQKMFPKNGEKFPEIRFKGFTEAWEQRKVSDLLQERNEQTPMSKEYPLMAFIANLGVAPKGERYDRSALVNDEAGKKYKKTEYGDFIYSSNNLEAGSIGLNKYGNACISPVYSIFKPIGKADLDFLGRRFLRKDFINEMVKWRQGVVYGQWKIHESDFLNIEIEVPSVDEQKAIGRYLDFLDHLITLHRRAL